MNEYNFHFTLFVYTKTPLNINKQIAIGNLLHSLYGGDILKYIGSNDSILYESPNSFFYYNIESIINGKMIPEYNFVTLKNKISFTINKIPQNIQDILQLEIHYTSKEKKLIEIINKSINDIENKLIDYNLNFLKSVEDGPNKSAFGKGFVNISALKIKGISLILVEK
jgi:hypothetical protein